MAVLNIKTYPDEVLNKKCEAVADPKAIDPDFIRDLIDTMYTEDGVGIAASQVGVSQRIIVVCPKAKRGEEKVYINPVIISAGGGEEFDYEGCLSVPGVAGEVKRYKKVTVTAADLSGKPLEITAAGFEARIFQHEIDHLDGILFIDRLGLQERQEALRVLREKSRKL